MKMPRFRMKKIRKIPDSGKKTGFLCFFSTFRIQFSIHFYKVWFYGILRSPWLTWCIKNPDFGKKPDSIIFRIFSTFLQNLVSFRDSETSKNMAKYTKIWYKMVGFYKVSPNSKSPRSRIASGMRVKHA